MYWITSSSLFRPFSSFLTFSYPKEEENVYQDPADRHREEEEHNRWKYLPILFLKAESCSPITNTVFPFVFLSKTHIKNEVLSILEPRNTITYYMTKPEPLTPFRHNRENIFFPFFPLCEKSVVSKGFGERVKLNENRKEVVTFEVFVYFQNNNWEKYF